MPTCTVRHCGKQSSATIHDIPRSPVGTNVTVLCRAGYGHTSGQDHVQCLAGGNWSAMPTCTATHCKALNQSTVSDIAGLAIGETATVVCRSGYDNMVGASTLQCMPGGKWSSLPLCVDINECLMEEKVCVNNCTNLTPGFMCTCSNGSVGCFGHNMAQTSFPSSPITLGIWIGMVVASLVLGALIAAVLARCLHVRCLAQLNSKTSEVNCPGTSQGDLAMAFGDAHVAETTMTFSDAYGVAVHTDEHNYDYVRP
eukprot:scpid71933/ scgid30203/ Complement receptor type 2; Complement C3d receptor; Epstein-Barr virus receptor